MKRIFMMISVMAVAICCTNSEKHALERLDGLCSEMFPADEPGAAVLVLKGDDVIFDKGYGLADLQTKVPIDGNTFFNIASVSKQFTAVAALQLAEKELLSLEDSIAMYHPEFSGDIWKRVRFKHLLSHCSGVPDARDGYTREQRIHGDDSLSMEYMKNLDYLNFETGTAYEYINPTFVLAGDIVSKVSGKPFPEYVRENIFTPAGMKDSQYFDPKTESEIPNKAHAYLKGEEGWYEYDYGEETFFATQPDGGIYTSTHEFLQWEKALRNNTVISEQSRILAHTPHTCISGSTYSDYQNRENTWYGYGWFIETSEDGSVDVIYHTGDNGGFKILAARYPKSNSLVLIFANRTDWDRYEVMQKFEEILGL